ncbi:MAG: ribosomal RNA small subunit methyltransferase A [Candidatus Zambryskibacteria bacterium RIFCSPHIGHO2_12_FULL_38_34]|nr:MAG: ribosomal RNA small subunit methyltransferase A [Candidatus Zambryskibacteria bacterium RIFCSPHIGHO2_02_FULL_38_22]OHA98244.1 MAG: ribosomal RNA small subunit methyltransferase A [Candidatus Zambryskibacteria bacterium RIFCSPHIGHO2_12_FULL_38_34]
MKAKKSLGQHFLRDKGILKKIANFADIKKEDVVLEVGPGGGSLTELLLEKSKMVIAIEKDKRMVELLKEKFSKEIKEGKLEVVEGDILDLKLGEPEKSPVRKTFAARRRENSKNSAEFYACLSNRSFSLAQDYILVGNIPYYITGALFKKALGSQNPPKSITFVVQKEVAERIMTKNNRPARPNGHSGRESILSISIKAYGKPEYGGIIKAGSFYPKPKVNSAMISIRNINKENFKNISETKFFEILKAGFAHKRKLLIRNLDKFKKKEEIKEIFGKGNISEKTRAENLSVENWIFLAKELQKDYQGSFPL